MTHDKRLQAFELLADIKHDYSQSDFTDTVFYLGRHMLRSGLVQECFLMLKIMYETMERVYSGQADFSIYEEMGNMLYLSGQIPEAIDWFTRMMEGNMAPESRMAFNIGLCYQLQQDYKAAIRFFQQSTSADPKYYKSWQNLGSCYMKAGEFERALSAFSQMPTSAETYTCIGNVYFQMGNFEEAVAGYIRAVEINDTDANALNNLGCALKRLELYEDALSAFNDSLAAKPTSEAVVNLLTLYIEVGKLEDAKNLFRLAEKHVTSADVRTLQRLYEEAKKSEEERQAGARGINLFSKAGGGKAAGRALLVAKSPTKMA